MSGRRAWLDALGMGMIAVALFPQVLEKRLWLYAAARVAREGARRCGQIAIAAEDAYLQEVAR